MKNINKTPKIKPCRAHYEWTRKVVAIGDRQGPEAAEQWIKEHPYVAED
jgi:hypothetical protein